jgi:hypothetical protein
MAELVTPEALEVDDGFGPVAEAPKPAPFFVVVGKSGFRRLHKANSCSVYSWACKNIEEVWNVESAVVDAVCRVCAKHIQTVAQEPDSSSSGDSSTEEEGIFTENQEEAAEADSGEFPPPVGHVNTNASWETVVLD